MGHLSLFFRYATILRSLLKLVKDRWTGRRSYAVAFALMIVAGGWGALPFLPLPSTSTRSGLKGDLFDPRIGAIRDLDALQREVPRYIVNTGNRKRDLAVALTKLVGLHTIHGVSRQSWRENWIANVLEFFAPEGMSLAGRMSPDDLMRDNVAFCSQASLLLQELFRRNGIQQATVRFNTGGPPPHSAVAANPDGVWRYYDPSYEPLEQGVPFEALISSDQFLRLYSEARWTTQGVDAFYNRLAAEGKIAIIGIDGDGPRRGITFQHFTEWVSNYGWSVPACLSWFILALPMISGNLRRSERERAPSAYGMPHAST